MNEATGVTLFGELQFQILLQLVEIVVMERQNRHCKCMDVNFTKQKQI